MTTGDPSPWWIAAAEVDGRLADVEVRHGTITAIQPAEPPRRDGGRRIDAGGGALLPGLHDHHLHLLAMAAALGSVDIADVDLDDAIRRAHRDQPAGAWMRVVGYDERRAGPLDRNRLDALAPGRPVRVQHRSGALWVLSSPALDALGAGHAAPAGVDGFEVGPDGRPTGRLHRLDHWLAARVPRDRPPDLAPVGGALVARGITAVTDATPTTDRADYDLLAAAVADGALPVAVMVTGDSSLATATPPAPLTAGPVKVVITDHELPGLEEVEGRFRAAHQAGRTVAVHCVSDVALVLALAAWDAVGSRPGDRVEHGSVVHPAHRPRLARHGLTVVTQPGFLHRSGDRYLADVDPEDLPYLYPCASLLHAGVAVGGSTDAPFGPADPWLAIATAVDRRSRTGQVVGPDEAVAPPQALDLFLADRSDPGGPARRLAVGAPADLCLLDRRLADALADPRSVEVVATVVAGAVVHGPGG